LFLALWVFNRLSPIIKARAIKAKRGVCRTEPLVFDENETPWFQVKVPRNGPYSGKRSPTPGGTFPLTAGAGGSGMSYFPRGVVYSRPPTNLLFLKEVNDVEDVQ